MECSIFCQLTSLGSLLSGIGTLLLGIAALIAAKPLVEEMQRKKKISQLKKEYPLSKINKSFALYGLEGNAKWWLVNLEENTKQHVKQWSTVVDMDWEGQRINISAEKLEKYKRITPDLRI